MRVWDPATGAVRHTLTGHTGVVTALAVAPDGSWLAAGDWSREVRVWDPATGTVRHTLTGHTGGVTALAVAPDGSWLASASNDLATGGEVRVWDAITGAALTSLRVAGHLSHLQATSTAIAAGGERGLYLLRLCRGSQPGQVP